MAEAHYGFAMTGTQTGDMPGLPATDRSFSIRGASVGELAGDKIKRKSDYWSLASLLQQLGILPAGRNERHLVGTFAGAPPLRRGWETVGCTPRSRQ